MTAPSVCSISQLERSRADATTRRLAEAQLEWLHDAMQSIIALLDAMDGDCELEEEGEKEPWLGGLPFIVGLGAIEDGEGDSVENGV